MSESRIGYRHEHKHIINWADYYALRQRLRAVAALDSNAGADGWYHIRSLYFDNDDDKALREKLYGLPNREKFRLRMYNHNADFVRLEKKAKRGGLSGKQSAVLTRAETERILAGDVSWLAETGNALLAEFYGKWRGERLRPRTIVDYRREAYWYPQGNVRVTFDAEVRTGVYATGMFEDVRTVGTGEAGTLLLEVKYDGFLPDIMRDVIQTNTRHGEAFSKYAACRVFG